MKELDMEAVPRVQRHHGLIIASFGISSIGDGLRVAALPLLALTITKDPMAIAGLAIASRLPWLFVALFSGAIADHVDRRRLMVGVDLCRAAVIAAAILALVFSEDRMWYLYALAVSLGVAETLFETATQGLLPQVVPPDELGRANGRLFTLTFVFDGFLGPAVGGWLFSLGRFVPLVGDVITFVVSAVLILVHRIVAGPVETQPEEDEPFNMLASVREGLSWAITHPVIRSFIVVSVAANFIQSAVLSVLVLFATGPVDMQPSTFGLLLASSGVGGFAGGWLSSRVAERLGVHRVLYPAVVSGVPLFLLMAGVHNPLVLGITLGVNAFMGVMASVQMAIFRQQVVPNHILSRVSSVGQFFSFGFAIPLGALFAGIVAGQFGTTAVYWSAAVITAFVSVVVWPHIRPVRLRDAATRSREESVAAG